MEPILSGNLHQVLVCANSCRLKRLGRQLLVLVGHHVDAERELIDTSTLAAEIEDFDFGVRYTTVESGLGVRLVYTVRLNELAFPFSVVLLF